jgi:DNA (cytosine-5)-methyltransferase 1
LPVRELCTGLIFFLAILYKPRVDEIREDEKLIIDGEDPYRELEGGNADDIYEDYDDEDGVPVNSKNNDNDKPIRELYDFYIFDPRHQNELVSLEALEIDDGVDRSFEAVGRVKAHFVSDEDDGQEDGLEDELEETGVDGRRGKGDGKRSDARRIRLSTIMRATVDYTKESEWVLHLMHPWKVTDLLQCRPFYIETMYAWYILMKPADAYTEFYKHFYAQRRVAQIVIAWAFKKPNDSYSTFLGRFTSRVDIFGHTYIEQDLSDSVCFHSRFLSHG